MVLNTCKLWSNGIKIASFSQKIPNHRLVVGSFAPRLPITFLHPSLWYVWDTLVCSLCIPIYPFWGRLSPLSIAESWLCANTQATAFDLLICNIFVPQKVPLSKISDASLHVICPPSPPSITNPGYAYLMHCSTLIMINKRQLLIKQELICVPWFSNKI